MNFETLEKRFCLDSYGPIPQEPVPPSIPLWRDSSVVEHTLESKFQEYNVDGISFSEMKDILNESIEDNYFNRFERLQIERYVRIGDMPDYVNYLSNAVVEDFRDADLNIVVDKWFNGKDLPATPSQFIVHETIEGELFVDGISSEDIKQGALYDCYFLTALGAVAYTSPEIIENMITEVEPNIWVVKIHDQISRGGETFYVTVNNELAVDVHSGNSFYANVDSGELWVGLIEKAYVQMYQNIRPDLGNAYKNVYWGDPGIAFEYITNQEQIRTKGMSEQGHIDYLDQNIPIAIEYNRHSYYFESYNPETEQFFLRNPYGRNHIVETWEELEEREIVSPRHGGYIIDVV